MIIGGIHKTVVIDVAGSIELPPSTVVEPNTIFFGGGESVFEFGEMNTIYPGCIFRIERGFIKTGARVSFGPGCIIYEPRAGLTIGANTLIAGGVKICGVNHGFSSLDHPIRDQPTRELPIEIGNDVWIGMGAIILPGVTIGDGCVIGANSVVNKDVPPMSIGVGSPFRVTGHRT